MSENNSDKSRPIAKRSYRGRSMAERKQARRRRLVDAGRALFAREGFRNSTVKALCAEASLTERYFYESFQSREELFVAVCEEAAKELRAEILRAVQELTNDHKETATPLEVTRAALYECFRLFESDRALARILLFECLGVSEEINRRYHEVLDEFAQFVLLLAAPWVERGLLELRHADFVPVGLVGAAQYIATRWALSGYEQDIEEVVDSAYVIYASLLEALL